MNPLAYLTHARARRQVLRSHYNIKREFATIEETCIPSYLHPNPLAAGVAWLRLFSAAKLYERYGKVGPVLDFGCGSGELRFVLPAATAYHFIDSNEHLIAALRSESPGALRRQLDNLPQAEYAAIFALDSLEHNADVEAIIITLKQSLMSSGVLIISGPTENNLYRLGRKISGFKGDYHETDIYAIEKTLARHFQLVKKLIVPAGIPLFSVTAWKHRL